ncbi:hypothetical protein BJ322DRAFT_1032164 [Thelephora terrestris]|uniref:Uncharacterized protein n=1 Tax=Thelephora terrestris TaxID=56493 RepID=A0A9P6LC17_9AGAM|nr:hypothetical protein BJ322DRAFT_1032164 [Thelephora terrestris]
MRMSTSNVSTTTPLSTTQERRLLDYLDEQFLELTRGYKKRSHPSSNLTTLPAYLDASQRILDLILQIPPVDPSASLRSTLLLRLTGEVFNSVPGYTPDEQSLSVLLDWLRDLDRGWLAVLRSRGWDLATRSGTSVQLPDGTRSTPLSQTERTRLKSMLVAGTEMLEEWIEALRTDVETTQAGRLEDLFSGVLAEMGFLRGEFSV